MQTAAEGGFTDTYYDYICVVDFEATCEVDNPSDFHHEIIEFPMVLINTHTLEIVSEAFEDLWPSSTAHCRFQMFFLIYPAGGLVSGIRKTRVKPTAFRLLCEIDRNHTGRLSPGYSDCYL